MLLWCALIEEIMGNESSTHHTGVGSSGSGGGGGRSSTGRSSTGGTPVSRAVERASKTGVLSLKALKLNEVPRQILSLAGMLKSLDISSNRIGVVTDDIGQFTNLRTLSLNDNKMARVPAAIGLLEKLQNFHLQSNALSSLPDSMGSLSSLKYLDISHNQLTSFPPSLYALPHLDYFKVSHNRLQALPEDGVNRLHAVELDISANSLSRLPAALSICRRLKVLRVEENCLDLPGLPTELLENSSVSLLCLDGNLIQEKDLQQVPGYDKYMERFTANRRKMD